MNKKIIISSTLIVFMLILLPTTTAQQNIQLPEYQDIQNMNITELFAYIQQISPQNPEELITYLEDFEDNDLPPENINNLANNESLLSRIWSTVANYRFFRLYLSVCITLYTQSTLSLMRTTHWAIKTLKWVQVGIMLGVIKMPDFTPPETPTILFDQNNDNNTLTVLDISMENIYWEDIENIGSGTCDPLPPNNITIGDMITNCTGIIVLRYTITDGIIGVYEFD